MATEQEIRVGLYLDDQLSAAFTKASTAVNTGTQQMVGSTKSLTSGFKASGQSATSMLYALSGIGVLPPKIGNVTMGVNQLGHAINTISFTPIMLGVTAVVALGAAFYAYYGGLKKKEEERRKELKTTHDLELALARDIEDSAARTEEQRLELAFKRAAAARDDLQIVYKTEKQKIQTQMDGADIRANVEVEISRKSKDQQLKDEAAWVRAGAALDNYRRDIKEQNSKKTKDSFKTYLKEQADEEKDFYNVTDRLMMDTLKYKEDYFVRQGDLSQEAFDREIAGYEADLVAWNDMLRKKEEEFEKTGRKIVAAGVGIGKAIGEGMVAGNMHDAFKSILQQTLGFLEVFVMEAIVASFVKALITGPQAFAYAAGAGIALGVANAAVASFATMPGETKVVPGAPGAPMFAIVHGQERISNPQGGGGAISINMGSVNIYGNADAGTVNAINRSREKQLFDLRRQIQELISSRQFPAFA